jgi:hypothetical protein
VRKRELKPFIIKGEKVLDGPLRDPAARGFHRRLVSALEKHTAVLPRAGVTATGRYPVQQTSRASVARTCYSRGRHSRARPAAISR